LGRIASVRPLWAIEGGRVTLEGDGFPIDPVAPQVRIGAQTARLASASATWVSTLSPGAAYLLTVSSAVSRGCSTMYWYPRTLAWRKRFSRSRFSAIVFSSV